jgi:hypothetical protein
MWIDSHKPASMARHRDRTGGKTRAFQRSTTAFGTVRNAPGASPPSTQMGFERSSRMPSSQEYFTTRAFAQKAGVSASTVSKWLRKKKIDGQKINGKWMIPASQVSKIPPHTAVPQSAAPATKPIGNADDGNNHYTIEEFSAMTYLTEFGVNKWLKEGRLIAEQDDSGKPMVSASNLENPNIKRLIR